MNIEYIVFKITSLFISFHQLLAYIHWLIVKQVIQFNEQLLVSIFLPFISATPVSLFLSHHHLTYLHLLIPTIDSIALKYSHFPIVIIVAFPSFYLLSIHPLVLTYVSPILV